jgi:hypothetical protein
VANIAPRRISERTGMRVVAVEERDCVGGRFPTEIGEITAGEWASISRTATVREPPSYNL